MKSFVQKTIALFTIIALVAMLNKTQAQGAGKVSYQDLHLTARVVEGSNAVPLPDGQGTLRFMVRGGQISNVMHQDATGKITRLGETEPGPTGSNPNPNPDCKWQERCVYNHEKGTAVCFCTPDVIKSNDPVSVALLLPAIQKVRDAASRL
ncbi:MAG: hypothetical protein U0Y10_07785 [Spirosomataceae bacterium]